MELALAITGCVLGALALVGVCLSKRGQGKFERSVVRQLRLIDNTCQETIEEIDQLKSRTVTVDRHERDINRLAGGLGGVVNHINTNRREVRKVVAGRK